MIRSRISQVFSSIFVIGIIVILLTFYFVKYSQHSTIGQNNANSSINEEIRPNSVIPGGHSYCSARATARGPNQKVVSYSFYGVPHDYRLYFFGIAYNAKQISKLYPDWTMRVHHQMKADHFTWRTFEAVERSFLHLDMCNVSALPVLGDVSASNPVPMTWRFLPLGDPSVKEFMSRDLDLYIHPREVEAVKEWWKSNLTFHVMRDNWFHFSPILGGMWGARRYHDSLLMNRLLKLVWMRAGEKRGRLGDDQEILSKVVWPFMKGKVLQHDSYFCKKHMSFGNVHPFPNQRQDNIYLGFRITAINEYKQKSCPIECRPKDHKNWTFC